MPKMKTKRAAAKRLKVTASGGLKHKKQNLRHILTKKTAKRKRQLRQHGMIADVDVPRMKQMLQG